MIRLTGRDSEVLSAIYLRRTLSARHLVGLGLFGSEIRANGRLRQLRSAGLITYADELLQLHSPRLHRVAQLAAPFIAHHLEVELAEVRQSCRRHDSLFQLTHATKVVEFEVAAVRTNRRAINWYPESLCHHAFISSQSGRAQRRIVKPDGLLEIERDSSVDSYFVEVDLGHVSREKFQYKLLTYAEYASGTFQETYARSSFSVLVVTTSERRINNLSALAPAVGPPILFTTFAAIENSGPFSRIWHMAGSHDLPPRMVEVAT